MQHIIDEEDPKKILVVEDDIDLLASIDDCLSAAGYQVVGATNGLRAQHLLETITFDLILSDWRVPDIGGLDLLCFVRQFQRTPFIMMTGFTDFIAQSDIYESGASAFLPKPFNQEDLILTVTTCLKSDEERRNLDNEFTQVEAATIPVDSTLKADLYLRISEENYVKVASKDSLVSTDRLKSHVAKGLKQLYVRNTDLSLLYSMNIEKPVTEAKSHVQSPPSAPPTAQKVLSQNPELRELINRQFNQSKR